MKGWIDGMDKERLFACLLDQSINLFSSCPPKRERQKDKRLQQMNVTD